MNSFTNILKENNIPFKNNKIEIPNWVKHIKIDIGLAYNAPQMQHWLSHENDLLVFGFEANPEAFAKIVSPTNTKIHPEHGNVLEYKYIGKNAYIIPALLSDAENNEVDFYITDGDGGTSSMYEPIGRANGSIFDTKHIIKLKTHTLASFFKLLPLDDIEYIEYIKTDAQGEDLKILKGAEPYLQNKVVCVTSEGHTGGHYYKENHDERVRMIEYMESIGFKHIHHPNTDDETFVNKKFAHILPNIFIYQKG